MKHLLIVKAGSAAAPVRVVLGDYDRWFVGALGLDQVRVRVVAADLGERLPGRVRDFDAVIATGSPRSVTERAPWMGRTGSWLREAAEQRVPVLGVCFGHQLLAEAFGGRVGRSPRGREIGTVELRLTAAGREDPLFESVPAVFSAQATHEDVVLDAPPELEVLASNGHSRIQAFRAGPFVRAVQFHPEFEPAALRALAESRLARLEAEAAARGEEPRAAVRAILAGIRPAPHARRVLRNFVARFT